MNKLILSLAALAALSTASFANDRNYDLRDTDTYTGVYADQVQQDEGSVNAFAVSGSDAASTAFERVTQTAIDNENGGH